MMDDDSYWRCECGHSLFSHNIHSDEFPCKHCECARADCGAGDDFRFYRAEAKKRHPRRFWASAANDDKKVRSVT